MKTYSSRLEMILEHKSGSLGAEIGVYRGDFSEAILRDSQVGHLYLVDPWAWQPNYNDTINNENQQAHYLETRRKMTPFLNDGRATIVRDFSANVAKRDTTIPPLDWVFVDAYHAYEAALEDITLWAQRLKPNGVIYAHDYFEGPKYGHDGHEWRSGVVQAVAEFCASHGWEVTGITTEDLPTARLEKVPVPNLEKPKK